MSKVVPILCRLVAAFFLIAAVPHAKAQTTGLSLSGGGALGYAHLGFLQAMDEAGVRPDCVAGCSMGAIMGMMYCAGYSPQEILRIVKAEHMDRLLTIARPSLPTRGGVVSTRRVQRVLLKYVSHNSFDSLHIPFVCCASDMNALQPRYQSHGGKLVEYVMASAAVPGAFAPVQIDGTYYVDGGMMDIMPVKPLMDYGCDRRIGVSLVLEKPKEEINPYLVWLRAVSFCSFQTTYTTRDNFTDVIDIAPGAYWMHSFDKIDELYQMGYEAGRRYFGIE